MSNPQTHLKSKKSESHPNAEEHLEQGLETIPSPSSPKEFGSTPRGSPKFGTLGNILGSSEISCSANAKVATSFVTRGLQKTTAIVGKKEKGKSKTKSQKQRKTKWRGTTLTELVS